MTTIAFFGCQDFDLPFLRAAQEDFTAQFYPEALTEATVELAAGAKVVSCTVSALVTAKALAQLAQQGCELLVLRSAGFDHVDLAAASAQQIKVVHIPEYSPQSIAEYALLLTLSACRHFPQVVTRSQQLDFDVNGLTGTLLHGKTVGVVGTGRIGTAYCRLLQGFGCEVLAFDPHVSGMAVAEQVTYVDLPELAQRCDVISLHCPLNEHTEHLVNAEFLACCKPNLILINTARGAVVDTKQLLTALQTQQIGAYAADVYEFEKGLFLTHAPKQADADPLLTELKQLPNVLISGHLAFLTEQAVSSIAASCYQAARQFLQTDQCANALN